MKQLALDDSSHWLEFFTAVLNSLEKESFQNATSVCKIWAEARKMQTLKEAVKLIRRSMHDLDNSQSPAHVVGVWRYEEDSEFEISEDQNGLLYREIGPGGEILESVLTCGEHFLLTRGEYFLQKNNPDNFQLMGEFKDKRSVTLHYKNRNGRMDFRFTNPCGSYEEGEATKRIKGGSSYLEVGVRWLSEFHGPLPDDICLSAWLAALDLVENRAYALYKDDEDLETEQHLKALVQKLGTSTPPLPVLQKIESLLQDRYADLPRCEVRYQKCIAITVMQYLKVLDAKTLAALADTWATKCDRPNERIQTSCLAVHYLHELGPLWDAQTSIQKVRSQLSSAEPCERIAALKCLATFGDTSYDTFLWLCHLREIGGNGWVHSEQEVDLAPRCMEPALNSIGDVLKLLSDENWLVRLYAASAVGRMVHVLKDPRPALLSFHTMKPEARAAEVERLCKCLGPIEAYVKAVGQLLMLRKMEHDWHYEEGLIGAYKALQSMGQASAPFVQLVVREFLLPEDVRHLDDSRLAEIISDIASDCTEQRDVLVLVQGWLQSTSIREVKAGLQAVIAFGAWASHCEADVLRIFTDHDSGIGVDDEGWQQWSSIDYKKKPVLWKLVGDALCSIHTNWAVSRDTRRRLRDQTAEVRVEALHEVMRLLSCRDDQAFLERILSACNDQDSNSPGSANALALSLTLGTTRSLAPLHEFVSALGDDDPSVVAAGLMGLKELRLAIPWKVLVDKLLDGNQEAFKRLSRALKLARWHEMMPYIIHALTDSEPQELRTLLVHESAEVRNNAAEALADIRSWAKVCVSQLVRLCSVDNREKLQLAHHLFDEVAYATITAVVDSMSFRRTAPALGPGDTLNAAMKFVFGLGEATVDCTEIVSTLLLNKNKAIAVVGYQVLTDWFNNVGCQVSSTLHGWLTPNKSDDPWDSGNGVAMRRPWEHTFHNRQENPLGTVLLMVEKVAALAAKNVEKIVAVLKETVHHDLQQHLLESVVTSLAGIWDPIVKAAVQGDSMDKKLKALEAVGFMGKWTSICMSFVHEQRGSVFEPHDNDFNPPHRRPSKEAAKGDVFAELWNQRDELERCLLDASVRAAATRAMQRSKLSDLFSVSSKPPDTTLLSEEEVTKLMRKQPKKKAQKNRGEQHHDSGQRQQGGQRRGSHQF